MKHVLLIAALVFGCFGSARAEEMRVRTGEHGDFTRMVLAFEALPPWTMTQTADGYHIDLQGSEPLVTDLTRVFALIKKDRISTIEVDRISRRVLLGLACQCEAEVFELNGNTLVLDVKESTESNLAAGTSFPNSQRLPESTAPSIETVAQPFASPAPDPQRTIFGGRPDSVVRMSPRPLQPIFVESRVAANKASGPFDQPATRATDVLPIIDRIPSVNSVAVEALTQQLGRAASQGLIDVNEDAAKTSSSALTSVLGPRNFRTFTGIDRANGLIAGETGATSEGGSCVPDRFVDLASWGDTSTASELGPLRAAVVQETGASDLDALRDLARYYIALGFGAEARFAAAQLNQGDERAVLFALADIVDTGSASAAIFDGQLACPGKVALWAALSGPFSRAELPVSTDVILTTFSALPPHLREHLGPVLSQRLRDAGETNLARAALSAVTRVGTGSIGQDLTAARLELQGTRADEARVELERLAQGTNVAAAEALLELLQDAARRKVTPKLEWVNDADTLIRVTDGTSVAKELTIASLRGHIPLGRFDTLRRALTDGRAGVTDTLRRDIAADALAAAVTDADDATFVRTELGLSDFADASTLDASTRYAYVARFLDLGLPRLAAKYLPDQMETSEERRLALATMAALNNRQEALSRLDAEPDQALADLQAALLADTGNHVQSARLLQQLGEDALAELQALRSGDWSWIAASGPDELASAVRAATAPDIALSEGSQNSGLIEDISARRAAYADLLMRTKPVKTP